MQIFKDTLPQRNLTKKEAKDIFEDVITFRNLSAFPFKNDAESTFRKHCLLVADIAETIAEKSGMDSLKAYVFGLLHDSGRYKDERAENTFHSVEGFYYLMKLNLPECARISITHSFYQKDFNPETYVYSENLLQQCRQYLKEIEYNDYDKLIQLSDILNDMGRMCTIEYRFLSISKRYDVPLNKFTVSMQELRKIKAYFDNKCGCDIYSLLNIED